MRRRLNELLEGLKALAGYGQRRIPVPIPVRIEDEPQVLRRRRPHTECQWDGPDA
ncbi:MAG: hypothetical protein IIB27_07980 [Chloroflexi bacterium]|nr:hypothetical protein [Chloroflexota bacterium]